jgi:MYXO-CTERM domain-containing protein
MKRLVCLGFAAAAATLALRAPAFCGFYVGGADTKLFNHATQVVLLREGTRTVLSMQNNYEGPPSGFAMVVPVPVVLQKESVKTLPRDVFDKIDQLDAPRLVEYWEQDPCAPFAEDESREVMKSAVPALDKETKKKDGDFGVKIEAKFAVGEYEIVILSAKDSAGLDGWLRQEKYAIPPGAEPYLRPYVQAGSKFFVAKVDAKKVKFDARGMAALSPLRFHYDSTDFSLPVRLGLINAKDAQDLVVHVLARGQRYEVANYPNVTIPTNVDLAESAKGQFAAFYAALFDATVARTPRAVVTEYAWDASTCDPCPGPALDGADIATLGADVLPAAVATAEKKGRGPFWGGGWTLTRLHARYRKDDLGPDLVFKAAPPIAGGREVYAEPGAIEHGAVPAATNNFQGRYVIRHPWTGPIACASPRRGIWGGPPRPDLAPGGIGPKAARDLAFAPRGNVQLASFVRGAIPELSLEGTAPPALADAGAVPAPSAAPPHRAGPELPKSAPDAGGCAGCATSGSTSGTAAGAFALLALAMGLHGRRKR